MTNDSNHPEQQETKPLRKANDSDQTPTQGSSTNSPGKKKLVKLIGSGIIVVIVLVALFFVWKDGGSKSNFTQKQTIVRYSVDGQDTVVMNGQKFDVEEDLWGLSESLDSSAIAVMTYDESSETRALWYLNGKDQPVKVADDIGNFVISDDGNKIAYITDVDEDFEYGTLRLFDGSKSEIIDHDVYAGYFHLSPDGNSIVYLKDLEEMNAYVKNGSKSPEKLGDYVFPFAVSNNAKYIYYMELDEDNEEIGHLYVQKGKDQTRLRSNVSVEDLTLLFNQDYSQVLISEDGRSYLSNDAKESIPVTRSELIFTVDEVASRSWGLPEYEWWKDSFRVFAVSDLTSPLFHNDSGDIVSIDRSGNSETLVSEAWDAYVTADHNKVVYIDERERLIRRSLKNPGEEAEIISRDVMTFLTTDDAKVIYYLDYNNDLYVVKGSSEPKLLMMDVDYPIDLTPDGKQVIFMSDYRYEGGNLYFSKNGGEPKKIAEDVYTFVITEQGMFFAKDYDEGYFDLYFTSNFSSSELIGSEAESLWY